MNRKHTQPVRTIAKKEANFAFSMMEDIGYDVIDLNEIKTIFSSEEPKVHYIHHKIYNLDRSLG